MYERRRRRRSYSRPGTYHRVRVGGADSSSMELDAWFAAAMIGTPAAWRSFTLTVFNSTGEPIRRFFVSNGIPIEMTHQNDRFQLVIKADAGPTRRAVAQCLMPGPQQALVRAGAALAPAFEKSGRVRTT